MVLLSSYAWSWGTTGSATGIAPTVNLPDGTTDITLTVTDDDGDTDTDMVSVTVLAAGSTPPPTPTTLSIQGLAASYNEDTTTTAQVSLNEVTQTDLVVSLMSSDLGEFAVPSMVTIFGGTSSASFDAAAVADMTDDGDIAVTITASASGFQMPLQTSPWSILTRPRHSRRHSN